MELNIQDDNDYGIVKLTINSNALSGSISFLIDGKVLDSFTMIK